MDREIAKRKWFARATPEERELGSDKLTMDSEGNFIQRTKLSSPSEYEDGGKVSGAPFSLPMPVLSALLSSFFKGEKEKPIVFRDTGEASTQKKVPPSWWPSKGEQPAKRDTTRPPSKQEEILTGVILQKLLGGKR